MFSKVILKWIFLTLNAIASLAMLLTLLGTILSPQKAIYLAYLPLFFPITLMLNVGFTLFWILTRKWYFIISLSIIIFSITEINSVFPVNLNNKKIERTDNHIKILTYNTKMCGEQKKHRKRNPNEVVKYILESNADIVCLQEFVTHSSDEYLTEKDMYRIFKKYKFKHIDYKDVSSIKKSGIATFSVYPIIKKERIEYNSGSNISIYSDIKIKNTVIRLINNHLESNRLTEYDRAMPIKLKDNFDADNISGVTRHLSNKLGVAYKLRANQADSVAKVVENSPYKVILCGDFNDVPPSYAYTRMKGDLKDAYTEFGSGFGWTFNEKYYGFRIDYVLYDSTKFAIQKYFTDKVNHSDHYPVNCTLNIKEN